MMYKGNIPTSYAYYKELYESIKPIRGRPDCRPVNNRRETWKTIIEKDLGNGEKSYAMKFHNTECVEYFANGDITLRIGSWATPLTAEFIHIHSPFRCWKQYNKVWVKFVDSSENYKDGVSYPIHRELRLAYDGEWQVGTSSGHMFKPVGDVPIVKRVVDRAKAKAAREPIKPFLEFAKSFFAMSDGWVMHETKKQVIGFNEENGYSWEYLSDMEMYERIKGNPDGYLKLMIHMLRRETPTKREVAETIKVKHGAFEYDNPYYDEKHSYNRVRALAYKVVEGAVDIYTVKEVALSSKAMTNIV
jgi:hypothetical protein